MSDGPMQTCTRRRAGAGGVGDMEETFCPMEDAADESEAEATSSSEEERMDLLVSEAKVRMTKMQIASRKGLPLSWTRS